MNYPEYRQIYTKTKCSKKTIFVDITYTYKYNPEKNVYVCEEASCSLRNSSISNKRCNGYDRFNEPCHIIAPSNRELPPDSKDFETPLFWID